MQFGNYVLLKKLGTGGMAEVFLARQTGLAGFERLVCIKRILPHLTEHSEFITMFQDEARIAANLNHPNIVQIYELGEIEGSYFIAMELIKGEDVRQIYNAEVAKGHIIPYVNAAQMIYGACNGLGFAHASCDAMGKPLGLVHRDISPQNILVTYNGFPKIVDFGVAKARGKMTETRSGVLKGKYSYMSPEQAKGKPIDGRSDIFATGIVLYEITTGQRLFKRENEIETLHAVMNCRVPPPSKIIPGYPKDLEEIVMHSLAAKADDRYATAYDFANDLEQFILDQGSSTSPQALGSYMQELFADKLKDDPYSPEKLEEMAKQASTISLAGHTPSPRRSADDTVPSGLSAQRRAGATATRVITPEGSEVIIEEEEVVDPKMRMILWISAVVMALITVCVLFLAFGTLKKPAQPLPEEPKTAVAKTVDQTARPEEKPIPPAAIPAPPMAEPQEGAKAEIPAAGEAAHKAHAESPKGYLTISADKQWRLSINGRERGNVPVRNLELSPGNYKLRFYRPDTGTSHTAQVTVKNGKDATYTLPQGQGTLFVNANPWAKISLGTGSKDDTPTNYQNLPAGDYQVKAECENGRKITKNITVTSGQKAKVAFDCTK
jgi:serine/threonine-protein kinase